MYDGVEQGRAGRGWGVRERVPATMAVRGLSSWLNSVSVLDFSVVPGGVEVPSRGPEAETCT